MKYSTNSKQSGHPKGSANVRETMLFLDHEVHIVRQPRRRNITLSMHPDRPLKVQSNILTSQKQILEFLLAKKTWIEKNLNKFEQMREQFKVPDLKVGSLFPFLGEMKYLEFAPTSLKKSFFRFEEGFLVCYLPRHLTIEKLNDSQRVDLKARMAHFYKTQAVEFLTERMQFWIQQTGLKPARLKFRAPRTRWGSCSSQKHISLNWKLICQPLGLVDYVIVHELCHLVHMNHSDNFWNLVESYLPNYQETEKILRTQERLGHFL